jgi:cytochrome c oxidase subunit III
VSVIIAFVVVMSGMAVWWLSRQNLASKPWLDVGEIDEISDTGASRIPTAKVGLWLFLAIVCTALALLVSAYFMRIAPDWRRLPEPPLLWLNTGVLILSSFALHRARVAAQRDQLERLKNSIMVGGASAIAFLVGQILVLAQLNDAGHFVAGNPAVAFFYLLTVAHGLHLLGGMVALGRSAARIWRGADTSRIRLSTELCATYWHFLLLVWALLFGLLLLTGRFADFAQEIADFICRSPGS